MFDNYTERAKMTIMKAQQLAMQMGHSIVGTEHLLLSLAAEEQGVAAKVLAQRGISAQGLYAQVKEVMGANPHISGQAVPFSPRIKRVLELAAVEAREMGHN
ncbi:MAG TPA: NDP-hexose 4-ketoreductase, partial [Firmicutes bacterium]|nr:NDP-hexose 4-ketoreductase [Bacillota bacterium]